MNRTVKLVRLCKTPAGWRRFPAVIGRNGKVKPDAVLVNGQETKYPTGRYQLRTYQGSRNVFTDIEGGPSQALQALKKAERRLSVGIAAVETTPAEPVPGRVELRGALEKFIAATLIRKAKRAAVVYRQAVEDFLPMISARYADEITAEDLLVHQEILQKRGLADRTVANRHAFVVSFLRYLKLNVRELAPRRPKFEKKLPKAYTSEELQALSDSLTTERQHIVYGLLLKAGLRERELIFLEWGNVDLNRGIVHVKSKPELGFTIKDNEERHIRIPSDLIAALTAYKAKSLPGTRTPVIATKSGQHDFKLLRALKRHVRAAGLACGECSGCRSTKECSHWTLKKFRSTCITFWLRSGLDLRSIMSMSGHSDIATLQLYLAVADNKAIADKVESISWR